MRNKTRGRILAACSAATIALVGLAAPAAKEFLYQHPGLDNYAVGGPASSVLNDAGVDVAKSFVGKDRFATAALIDAAYFGDQAGVTLANGITGADAAVAGAYAANRDLGVLLALPNRLTAETSAQLAEHDWVKIFGGTLVIADGLVEVTN